MGGSIYTSYTLHHLKELGLDTQRPFERAHKAALKLHAITCSAHSVHKLTTSDTLLKKKTAIIKVLV